MFYCVVVAASEAGFDIILLNSVASISNHPVYCYYVQVRFFGVALYLCIAVNPRAIDTFDISGM